MPSTMNGGGSINSDNENENDSTGFSTCSTTSQGREGSSSAGSTIGNTDSDAVTKDNRMVTIVRCAAFLVLLICTAGSAHGSYKLLREGQNKAFLEAFHGVATKLVPGLKSDLNLRMWQATTVAAAVKTKLEDQQISPHLLDFGGEALYDITQEARFFSRVHLLGWNPLLRTEQERVEFEQMAEEAQQIGLGQDATVGGEPVCYICDSPDRTMSNPDFFVDLPGIGPTSCSQIEKAGLAGLIPVHTCVLKLALVDLGCNCVEAGEIQKVDYNLTRATRVSTIDEESGVLVPKQNQSAPYMPLWNIAGTPVPFMPKMFDLLSSSHTGPAIERMMEMKVPTFTETISRTSPFHEKYTGRVGELSTTLLYPVEVKNEIVGSVSFELLWGDMIIAVAPELSEFVHVVIENNRGQNFTFGYDPDKVELVLIGEGDLHESAFDSVVLSSEFADFNLASHVVAKGDGIDQGVTPELYCEYRFHVFATQDLMDRYVNAEPFFYGAGAASIFVFTSLIFILYDCLVRRVQRKVVDSAKHNRAIVTSLFPKNVRDRMLQQVASQSKNNATDNSDAPMRISKMRMQSFLAGGSDGMTTSAFNTDPIADLFASATVMFLDICSFTAWSSEREPSQVFILLETIYQAFDQIAGRLNVFKVETIGDSYVAVCGLPTRREGHAPVMAKFAQQCLAAMNVVTKELEIRLGPSTGDLQARVGLHSGPVTAGVMRGEKARFQLFGDTVNTASRLESSGKPNCIHLSQACVDLLDKAGKGHWVLRRENLVSMKGKGDLQTYFLKRKAEDAEPIHPKSPSSSPRVSPKSISGGRLVDWNTEVLMDFLKRIVVHRRKRGSKHVESLHSFDDDNLVINELTEKLSLPSVAKNTTGSTDKVKIRPEVKGQLRAYVKRIAAQYRDVPFHNFAHCSHVLMSTSKLMKRIVNPDDIDYKQTDNMVALAIHKTTYGISSDPILQFASLFAALIHDVDHTGLTNAELIDEKAPLAEQYRNQSVAEQHSVDLAWTILMEPTFSELRKCIYGTEEELVHFRRLVVNAVMATDIADKELKQARETRWAETFPANPGPPESAQVQDEPESQHDRDRKATIVYEYIIQASDVSHTMQHWHTYQKFNKRLFEERYVAWLNGSLKKEPSLGWYGGELWFFDNYIIPMANKLAMCGVFGVSYHEYLTYAKENRLEWERKGKVIVAEMKSHCDRKYAAQLDSHRVDFVARA